MSAHQNEAGGSSPPTAGDGGTLPDDKPRLTEEEKKQNHIASGSFCFTVRYYYPHCILHSCGLVPRGTLGNMAFQSKSADRRFVRASTA